MTNAPQDAPDLLQKNPETTTEDIAEPFVTLYRRARHRFCHEVMKCPSAQSVWDATMRPTWSPSDNTIGYNERLSKLISRSWDEARPPVQQAARFIEADPTLLDIHSGLAHTFDVRKGHVMPEKIALFNLRMWVTRGLRQFWDRKLTGELTALLGVQSNGVQLKGMAPKPLLQARINAPQDLSSNPADAHADCPRHSVPSNR